MEPHRLFFLSKFFYICIALSELHCLGRPPGLSHSSWALNWLTHSRLFNVTLRPQRHKDYEGLHIDFDTAPELCYVRSCGPAFLFAVCWHVFWTGVHGFWMCDSSWGDLAYNCYGCRRSNLRTNHQTLKQVGKWKGCNYHTASLWSSCVHTFCCWSFKAWCVSRFGLAVRR